MFTTFNMGVGLVIVVAKEDAEKTVEVLRAAGETPYVIGRITEGSREVKFTGANV
ncbi:Phosphoribosylformylglycinamidine cyclo-ligase [compost metagenome]